MLRPFLPKGTRVVVREGAIVSSILNSSSVAPLWRTFYRRFYPRADQVICQSNFMRQDLKEAIGVTTANMTHIYNPVDVAAIDALSNEGENPFISHGQGPHVVTVGRLAKIKNYDNLVLRFRDLVSEKPDAHLWLLGTGPEQSALEELARAQGIASQVHFMGHQSNPYLWLKYADLFVLCSKSEGLPNALLEAVACRCPVISTVHPGGTGEIFANIGQSKRFVEALNWEPWWFERPETETRARLVSVHDLNRVVLQYQEVLR